VGLCFTYFFLVMASYYTLKPVREAFFLDSEGVQNFPKVHILLVFVTYVAAQVYDSLARVYRGGWLAARTVPCFALLIVAFWAVLRGSVAGSDTFRALVWTYYLGVSLYCVFVVAFFWSLTHSVFTPEDGKRHYGVIGLGGILGGAAGGLLTKGLVPHLGSTNMLLVSAALLLPCFALGLTLDRQRLPDSVRVAPKPHSNPRTSLSLLFRDRYVGSIALLILLVMGFEEFGDHQTQRLLSEFHLSGDELTLFYGQLYTGTNLLGCLVSLFLTRAVLTRWGPGPGLWLLPLAGATKAIAVLIWPSRETLLFTLSLNLGLHYSIFQASKELLYTPTADEIRYRAKTMIDTFCFRLGAGMAALVVLIYLLHSSMAAISACIVSCALGSLLVGGWLQRRFLQLLEQQAGR
jgi:AAA family ATP:ADP antiporter